MKRTALVGLLLVTATGCGHGWLPFRPFRGAPCRLGGTCMAPAGPIATNCDNCGEVAGYSNYEGSVSEGEVIGNNVVSGDAYGSAIYGGDIVGSNIVGGQGYYDGQVINEGSMGGTGTFQGRGSTIAPPMSSIPSNSTLPSPSLPSNGR